MNEQLIINKELNWYDDLLTASCINCLKAAKIYSGHVQCGEVMVSSGFCSKCHALNTPANEHGSHGEWKIEYGLKYYDLRNE